MTDASWHTETEVIFVWKENCNWSRGRRSITTHARAAAAPLSQQVKMLVRKSSDESHGIQKELYGPLIQNHPVAEILVFQYKIFFF